MGRVVLVGRLAARDLRRRPGEAALLLLAIMAATTTLALGLVLHGVTNDPYEQTREASAGPDVVAIATPDPLGDGQPADLAGLRALTDAPGVVGHSGPYPVIGAVLETNGHRADAQAIGRDVASASVDQPKLTQGAWVRDGGVVLEGAFADALGVETGDRLTLDGRSFEVVGIAVTAATPPHPEVFCLTFPCTPGAGVAWLTQADVRSMASNASSLGYVLNLALADPAAAPSFVDLHTNDPPAPFVTAWQDILDETDRVVRNERRVLVTGGWLLSVLAVASVAVLVGGRISDQTRRVGLLKAVGGTPGLVAAVLLAEYVAVALIAAAAGLAVGWLAAPVLTDPGSGLLGGAGPPSLTVSSVGVVTAAALGVAVAATLVPAIRATRISTVLALADSARPPRRTAWLIAFSRRLPVPLLLGARIAVRRPRRTALSAASICVTVSGVVAALGARTELNAEQGDGFEVGSRIDLLNEVLLAITVTLIVLAAVNAVFITWATVSEARHSSALARALGATPGDVSAALSAAQLFPALAGAVLGIPVGIALLAVADPDGSTPVAPFWQLLAVVPATVLVVAALTAIPARLGARRHVAPILQAELA
jgi:ABC-type lipoprotein release transport system permease subunit